MSLLNNQLSKANDVLIIYTCVAKGNTSIKLSEAEVTYKYLTT